MRRTRWKVVLIVAACGGAAALVAMCWAWSVDQSLRHETDLMTGRVGKLPARAGELCELSLAGLPAPPIRLQMLPLAIVAGRGTK